jgi:hypothetical protein
MFRRVSFGLALMAGALLAGAGAPARAADAKQPPDLTGQWRLDVKRSDSLQRPEGGGEGRGPRGGGGWGGPRGGGAWGGRGGRGGGEGGYGGRGGRGGGEPGGPGGPDGAAQGAAPQRPARLPDLMHITQTPEVVSFEDSAGTVVQEITTLGGGQDTLAHSPGAQVMSGEWQGEKLLIQRQTPRGGTLSITVSLEGKGEQLVIETKMEGSGDMPSRSFKRVYERVKG